MPGDSSNMVGRKPGIVESDVLEIMRAHTRPVWSSSDMAEVSGVSRVTAKKKLEEMAENGAIESIQVANADVFYKPGVVMEAPDADAPVVQDLRIEFEDRFVGLVTAPWTAISEKDGPAEAGDKIQIQVHGKPGNWGQFHTYLWKDRRNGLDHRETSDDEVQALISGELYEKPTVPIEHVGYPDDYDLELNIGGKFRGDPPNQEFVARGVKNYLIRPVNDAVFLRDVEVDYVSPIGQGQQIETYGPVDGEIPIRDRESWQPDTE